MTARVSRRSVLAGLCLGALTASLAACGGGTATTSGGSAASPQKPIRNITVLLDWFPNPDHVALYMAQSKGYFKDAGLNVTLQAPSDPSDPPKLVSTGKVELGISYEPEMFSSAEAGLKVKAVGALIPTALNSVIATKASPVKSITDLKGKTVGDAGLSSDEAFLHAIYAKYGIDPSSVKTVNLKTSLIQAMVSNNVDATIGGYRNIEAVQLQEMGQDPLVVPVTDAGVPNYDELVVIANSDKLSSDSGYQQTVRDFLSALAKGVSAAQASPADAKAAMQDVAKGYDKPTLAKMVEQTIPLMNNAKGPLSMDPAEWAAFGNWMRTSKLIKSTPTISDLMTSDYTPKQ